MGLFLWGVRNEMHNDKYSYKDFLQRDLRSEPALDFSGEIVGSCFQQDVPNTPVFPPDATATFVRCNLNNCEIPPGCTVGPGCCAHQHAEQNDREQWILDKQNRPMQPLNAKQFDKLGLSKDPKDIPGHKLEKSVTQQADEHQKNRDEILDLRKRADELELVTPNVRVI